LLSKDLPETLVGQRVDRPRGGNTLLDQASCSPRLVEKFYGIEEIKSFKFNISKLGMKESLKERNMAY